MKIRLFFLLILLLCPFHFRAQNASADSLEIMKRSHGFRTTQLILPASLIAVGAVGVSTPWFRSLNREVRDGLAEWRDGRYFNADDYIKFCKNLDYYLTLQPEPYTGDYSGGDRISHGLSRRLEAVSGSLSEC